MGDAWCDGVHNNFEIIDLIGSKVPALAEAPSWHLLQQCTTFLSFQFSKEEDPMCQCALICKLLQRHM